MKEKKYSRREIFKLTGRITLAIGTGVVTATSLSNCGDTNGNMDDGGMSDGTDAGYDLASAKTLSSRAFSPVET